VGENTTYIILLGSREGIKTSGRRRLYPELPVIEGQCSIEVIGGHGWENGTGLLPGAGGGKLFLQDVLGGFQEDRYASRDSSITRLTGGERVLTRRRASPMKKNGSQERMGRTRTHNGGERKGDGELKFAGKEEYLYKVEIFDSDERVRSGALESYNPWEEQEISEIGLKPQEKEQPS